MTIFKFLFDNVPVGTRVQLIDQPVKYSVEPDGSHWLEVHEPLSRKPRGVLNPTEKSPCR
ncbi:L,D-transpeptidase ErfK [Klebsiella pneumoniae]|uniref:L,D-transpeptidase ErfK n=1 Tax=Klebsiella pneumoniae TaxID=573 RepID=A0A3S4GH68_KLEPN|nr:L,D-transpeptidase ErfK [Klebsiella pneumoniae]